MEYWNNFTSVRLQWIWSFSFAILSPKLWTDFSCYKNKFFLASTSTFTSSYCLQQLGLNLDFKIIDNGHGLLEVFNLMESLSSISFRFCLLRLELKTHFKSGKVSTFGLINDEKSNFVLFVKLICLLHQSSRNIILLDLIMGIKAFKCKEYVYQKPIKLGNVIFYVILIWKWTKNKVWI